MTRKRIALRTGKIAALTLFVLFAVGPLLWIVITSLKDPKEIYTFPITYFPARPSLRSYAKLFSFADFGVYFRNSMIVTLIGSIGAMTLSVSGGYALSRFPHRRTKAGLMLVLYFTQMIPPFILMMPLYTMMVRIRGVDSLGVLSVIYMVTVLAFSIIMARSFFDRIPISLEEAAQIDGCSMGQSLFRVVIPLMMPGLVAIFIFAFVNIWNELFVAVLFLSSSGQMTVPVALNSFISKAGISWDVMSAGLVMALLPTMAIFAVGQKYIVAGLTEGGVKA